MNPDDLIQFVQKGFHVSLGATTTLIESLQDPQRRAETLTQLQTNPTQLVDEWAVKGERTEREARTFVESLVGQQFGSSPSEPTTVTTTATTVATPDIQDDLRELTAQLAAIRSELEKLRAPNP